VLVLRAPGVHGDHGSDGEKVKYLFLNVHCGGLEFVCIGGTSILLWYRFASFSSELRLKTLSLVIVITDQAQVRSCKIAHSMPHARIGPQINLPHERFRPNRERLDSAVL